LTRKTICSPQTLDRSRWGNPMTVYHRREQDQHQFSVIIIFSTEVCDTRTSTAVNNYRYAVDVTTNYRCNGRSLRNGEGKCYPRSLVLFCLQTSPTAYKQYSVRCGLGPRRWEDRSDQAWPFQSICEKSQSEVGFAAGYVAGGNGEASGLDT
jgi:hypothetical protein